MNICKSCNKEYDNTYGGKYKYTADTTFCSRKCATHFQMGSITGESLRAEVIAYLVSEGRYCSREEIRAGIGRSGKTLSKYKISVLDIQRGLGMMKPSSVFQSRVGDILSTIYMDIEQEFTFKGLLSPKGFPLFVDFHSSGSRLLIEADGVQHCDVTHGWYSEYSKLCDLIKDKYAVDNNYKLIRIPYTRNVTKEYVLKYLRA